MVLPTFRVVIPSVKPLERPSQTGLLGYSKSSQVDKINLHTLSVLSLAVLLCVVGGVWFCLRYNLSVAQAGIRLEILLPFLPRGWESRHVPPHLTCFIETGF